MNWKKCRMKDALLFGKSRVIGDHEFSHDDPRPRPDCDAEVIWFTDGTAVACQSDWDGPLSAVTPNVDAKPALWWIYS